MLVGGEGDKQAKRPWCVCQKAPSVTVTWGWARYVLVTDLGNNTVISQKQYYASLI